MLQKSEDQIQHCVNVVLDVIYYEFGATQGEIMQNTRKESTAMPRQVAHHVCCWLLGASLIGERCDIHRTHTILGKLIGNRDCNTVRYSDKAVLDRCKVDKPFAERVQRVRSHARYFYNQKTNDAPTAP